MTIGQEEPSPIDVAVGRGVDLGEPGPFQIEKAPPDTVLLRAIWLSGSESVCAIRRDSGASSRRRSSSWVDVSPKSPSSSVEIIAVFPNDRPEESFIFMHRVRYRCAQSDVVGVGSEGR